MKKKLGLKRVVLRELDEASLAGMAGANDVPVGTQEYTICFPCPTDSCGGTCGGQSCNGSCSGQTCLYSCDGSCDGTCGHCPYTGNIWSCPNQGC